MTKSDAIAFIPARGGSKRFPRKNIADLYGRPLLAYPLKAALDSGVFMDVVVSTEDVEISKIARQSGGNVDDRSDQYATDVAHELEACLAYLEKREREKKTLPDLVCVIYPTAVMVRDDDLIASKDIFERHPETESVMCVSGFNYHPYKMLVENDQGYLEMKFPKECKQRSQTYPHAMASNGTFYWLKVDALRSSPQKSYYQDNLRAYEIPFERAVDIDYPEDLEKIKSMEFSGNKNMDKKG